MAHVRGTHRSVETRSTSHTTPMYLRILAKWRTGMEHAEGTPMSFRWSFLALGLACFLPACASSDGTTSGKLPLSDGGPSGGSSNAGAAGSGGSAGAVSSGG